MKDNISKLKDFDSSSDITSSCLENYSSESSLGFSNTFQWAKRINAKKADEIYIKYFGSKYIEYRKIWNKSGYHFLPEYPIHIDFEIIDLCNLKCKHCFRDKNISKNLDIKINQGVYSCLNHYLTNMSFP